MKPFPLLSTLVLITGLLTPLSWADDPNEPAIVIRHSDDKTYYEYSINGQVKEIKVVPNKGPTYYLIPVGGDNQAFRRATQSNLVVPKWVIFSW